MKLQTTEVEPVLTPRVQIFVCTNLRAPDDPLGCSCAAAGSMDVYDALRQEVMRAGRSSDIWVTRTDCMVHCRKGPTVVVYPKGDWYTQVEPGDARQIVAKYL